MSITAETALKTETDTGELKPGWRVVRFGDVVSNVDVSERQPLEQGLERFVGLDHLDPESLHIKRWGLIEEGTSFTRKFVSGQVLFGKRRAYQRKAAVAEFDGICSGDILVFEPKGDELLPELLPFIVQSDGFYEHALGTSAGSLSPRTKWSDLARYEFALPPKDEQHRIADILWAADEAVETNQNVIPQLQIFKSLYFENFLSDERNLSTGPEDNDELLESIRIERHNRWVDSQLAAFKKKGSIPTDKDWRSNYREPEPIDASNLDLLPKGWCWVRAEQVCEHITKGATPAKSKLSTNATKIPFIKVYNLTFTGELDFTIDPTFIDLDTHLNELYRSRVFPDDVVMNIVGPPLGKVSKVPATYPEWNINQAVVVFRPLVYCDADYLCTYLLRKYTQDWLYSRSKKTSGQRNLTLELCRDLPLPLPPLAVQKEIVSTLHKIEDALLSAYENINKSKVMKKRLIGNFFASALGQ